MDTVNADAQATYPHHLEWPKSAVRIIFGIVWLIDALLKWQPGFRSEYLSILQQASQGQAQWIMPWFNFWINLVTPNVPLFYYGTAILETYIAVALILGFARKTTYMLAAGFSLMIWSTAEGFGGPYTAGATDIGTGIIYAIVFLMLLALNANPGTSKYSIDNIIEKRFPWWKSIAELTYSRN